MDLPVKGVHCIRGKNPPLVGTIAQSVGASTSTGSPTSSVPSSSESSVNTFQAGCVELLSEFNIEDNLPASETQLSSTQFYATLTQVKAKMLPYNLKQARDIAAGRRRQGHEATSKASTRFSNDRLPWPPPPVPLAGNSYRPWEFDWESAEHPANRRELPQPPPPPSRPW